MRCLILTLTGLFLAVNIASSQSVAGTWVFNNGNFPLTMLLLDNGTGEFQGVQIKYRIQNGKLFFDDGIQPVTYNYQLTSTTLTLSGGDMQASVTFTRAGSSSEPAARANQNYSQAGNAYSNSNNTQSAYSSGNTNNNQPVNNGGFGANTPAMSGGSSGLSGIWDGQQGKLVFYPDGSLLYNGASYLYSVSGSSINISTPEGNTSFNYSLANNQLTLSQNANSSTYTKTSALRPDGVDQQMAGKWCIMSNNYNAYSGGGSSSAECITLNADGSYIYNSESSRSAYTVDQSAYGGTANQNSDRGTWRTDGLSIVSVSQVTGKTNRYSLLKQNVKNGDAAIVIGGKVFVTSYNRPGW